MRNRKVRPRAAFTLIQLVVVVLILGILLAVAIALYLSSVRNSAQQAIKANMKTIATAAQAYKRRTGSYPPDFSSSKSSPALYANFIGPGKNLERLPVGPNGVYYRWATSTSASASDLFSDKVDAPAAPTAAGQFIVRAKENGRDVFGSNATDSDAYLNLATGGSGKF